MLSIGGWIVFSLFSNSIYTFRDAFFWSTYAFFASPALTLPALAMMFKPPIKLPVLAWHSALLSLAYWVLAPRDMIVHFGLALIVFPIMLWCLTGQVMLAAVMTTRLMKRSIKGVWIWPVFIGTAIVSTGVAYGISLLTLGLLPFMLASISMAFVAAAMHFSLRREVIAVKADDK
jgi:hypothetical protein